MQLKQRGDTIVEVLIAIAVMSGVLGTSYAITSRNSKASQQAQEHSQALKVAETQLEQLKGYLNAGGSTPATFSDDFCMYVQPDNKLETDTTSNNCKKDDDNAPGRYAVAITKTSATSAYTVTVKWSGPTGHNDQVSLAYRIY